MLVSNDSEDLFCCCCHSTKTAQSIKPDANIKMSDPNLAELNGPFVVHILQEVFVSFVPHQVTEQNKRNVGSTMAGGLYMFFVMPQGSQEERYCPIYVGYTSRTFRNDCTVKTKLLMFLFFFLLLLCNYRYADSKNVVAVKHFVGG